MVYRKDRSILTSPKLRGGGVLIAVSYKLISSSEFNVNSAVEELYVSVLVNNVEHIFGAVYIPPSSALSVYENHVESVEYIAEHFPKAVLHVCGDYNIPEAKWCIDDIGDSVVEGAYTRQIEIISDCFNFLNLNQFNLVKNSNNVILDLCFSAQSEVNVFPSDFYLTNIDENHPPLLIQIPVVDHYVTLCNQDSWRYNFRKGDYAQINNYFENINWNLAFSENVNDSLSLFYDIITVALEMYVPKYKIHNDKFPSWYSYNTKNSIKNKNKIYNRYKKNRDPELWSQYKVARTESKKCIENDYKKFIDNTQANLNVNNIKSFWKFINAKKKIHGLPNCMCYRDAKSDNGLVIANMFADYFNSTYTTNNNFNPDMIDKSFFSNYNLNLVNLQVSVDEVFNSLQSLNTNKSAGPDGISPYFLKFASPTLAYPLCLFFNLSLKQGCFPDQWKEAFITPIFKSGNKSNVENYRPISGLSVMAKLFEKMVTEFITPSVRQIIIPEQHGFLQGKSTVTNLLCYSDFITNALENGTQVDSIYTDLKKAFDRVDHNVLLLKLALYGIGGNLLEWFKSYLTNRKQYIVIQGYKSNELNVTSGVPQGSHLGPVLFLLFINDISSVIRFSKVLLFADDLKLFKSVGSITDCHMLQNDLSNITLWCEHNFLDLNIGKCKTISFSKKKGLLRFNYYIRTHSLDRVSTVTDLGIMFDDRMSFIPHINRTVNKAYRMCGFVIRQCQQFTNFPAIILLFNSLSRSILEYGSIIWAPTYQCHINQLERVQKNIVKFLMFKLNLHSYEISYPMRLSMLGMESLELRRVNADKIFMFKLFNNAVDCPSLLGLFSLNVPSYGTRSTELIHVPFNRTNYGQHSATTRLCKYLNDCSRVDIFNTKLSHFKTVLKLHNSNEL